MIVIATWRVVQDVLQKLLKDPVIQQCRLRPEATTDDIGAAKTASNPAVKAAVRVSS